MEVMLYVLAIIVGGIIGAVLGLIQKFQIFQKFIVPKGTKNGKGRGGRI